MTTSKTIETLVEDIYGLFDPDYEHTFDEEQVQAFGQRLASHITNRISETRKANKLRVSNLGTPCERKLYYSINSPGDSEPLPPEARIKFLFGDILEELLLFLAAESGHRVEGTQDTVVINGVEGHRDAVIDGVIVDVKSASTYSFKKFEEHRLNEDDPFGYLDQIGAYAYASKDDPVVTDKSIVAFLVIDKTLGNICLDIHPTTDKNYDELVDQKRAVINSSVAPGRGFSDIPDGKSGNRKLDTNCSYCDFKFKCWPGLQVYAYSGKPRFLTNVSKEPKVQKAVGFGEE